MRSDTNEYYKSEVGDIYARRHVGNGEWRYICIKSKSINKLGACWKFDDGHDELLPVHWDGKDFIDLSLYYEFTDDGSIFALIGKDDAARMVCITDKGDYLGKYYSSASAFGSTGKDSLKPIALSGFTFKLVTGTRYKKNDCEYIVNGSGALQGYVGSYDVIVMHNYMGFTCIDHKPVLGDIYYSKGDYLIVCPERLACFAGPNAGIWVDLSAADKMLFIGRIAGYVK